jgi:hypothetical protein
MTTRLQRRTVLGGAIAGAALLQGRAFAQSGPNPTVIPWSDQPPPVPPPLENVVKGQTPWESLDSAGRRRHGCQTGDACARRTEVAPTARGHQHP